MVRALPDDSWFGPGLFLGLLVLALLGDGSYRLWRRAGGWRRAGHGRSGATGFAAGGEAWAYRVGRRILLGLITVPWIVLALDLAGIPIGRIALVCAGGVIFTVWEYPTLKTSDLPSSTAR